MSYSFDQFIMDTRNCCEELQTPTDIVCAMAPRMQHLLQGDREFLTGEHFNGCEDGYTRNAVFICPEGSISLFSMVWQPGQFTPIHDHGTWGVVGVVQGALVEQSYHRIDDHTDSNEGVELDRGGYFILGEGSVSTFVPTPDHIHTAGNPETSAGDTVTLHLYGRDMNAFNVYDLKAKTREPFQTECSEKGLLNANEKAASAD